MVAISKILRLFVVKRGYITVKGAVKEHFCLMAVLWCKISLDDKVFLSIYSLFCRFYRLFIEFKPDYGVYYPLCKK
jgi:hypothetical protein